MEQDGFWAEVRGLIESRNRFVLATHVNADGDGLGAQLALGRYLARLGKDVRVINTDPIPHNYSFLPREGEVEIYDSARHDDVLRGAEVIVLLDNSSARRLGRLREPIQSSPAIKVCIDHHPQPDTIWDVMAIEETASATGQMIYRLIREMNGDLPAEVAEPIYVAIVTDTGNFRFSNTKPEILRIAADLVEHGVDVPRVYQQIYERYPEAYTRLMGAALADLRMENEGRLGYLVVTREMLDRCSAGSVDLGDLINMVLTIDGARVALLFRETAEGGTKVSLRSKGTIDVNRIAVKFGGGGHRNASGVVMQAPLAAAMESVLSEVRRIV